MFVDLRDRILRQGGIPPARGLVRRQRAALRWWHVVRRRLRGRLAKGPRLDVAVVDVSGKGEAASTRALLLSVRSAGSSGPRPDEFLPAANAFVLRQDWEEGFATAIHLCLDLRTGAYELRGAGHPPAAVRETGSGRWHTVDTEGPVLGLIEGASVRRRGRDDAPRRHHAPLHRRHVETPTRDISLGIDRMLGQASGLLRGRVRGGATRLIETLGSSHDDRALLLVHRR
jgi:hypothetical protein